ERRRFSLCSVSTPSLSLRSGLDWALSGTAGRRTSVRHGPDPHEMEDDMEKKTPNATGSTTQAGIPAVSDRNSLTVGNDGPIVLHDHHLIETMQHFNRMNVPERRPHAKGAGAFGTFEVTEDVSQYTKADFLQPGRKTEMLARFSTVAGELGSPDTWRDVRGFAL